jgi:hypothetical protein
MANQARVTSLDAIEAFRSSLIVFLNEARRCLDEVVDEVRRTRSWLEHDQWLHWEGEIRRRQKRLDQAQQELFGARLSGLREVSPQQQMAVRRAKEAVAHAEEKLRNVKRWRRNYDSVVEPLSKGLESFRWILDVEMPKALVYLVQVQKTLEGYAEIATSAAQPAPAPPRDSEANSPASPESQPPI